MSWPDPPIHPDNAAKLQKIMEADPSAAAKLIGCSPGQAAAYQRYVVLACVVKMRQRRGIPHAHEDMQARALMRCLPPGVRNVMPEALRFAL